MRAISATIERIPGLEALVEKISETLTVFVLSLLAPFVRPIINAVSAQLKNGSSSVVDASGKHQYEPWTDPHCADPTHSLLSKDHFSNILNEPAGQVAASILQYVAPRVIYAWQHPDIPVAQVLDDVVRVFHHPALRDNHCEAHRNMYDVVQRWAHSRPNGSPDLDHILSSDSVRHGKNHIGGDQEKHSHGGSGVSDFLGSGTHSKVSGAPWEKLQKMRNTTGVGRDDIGGDVGDIPAAYHGTATAYPEMRPPAGPEAGYPAGHQSLYGTQYPNSYPPTASHQQEPDYDVPPPSAPSWNQAPPAFEGYTAPQQSGYGPPQASYPAQQDTYPPLQQGYEYGAQQPPHGYDPDAPLQHQKQGSYGAPHQQPPPPPGGGYY